MAASVSMLGGAGPGLELAPTGAFGLVREREGWLAPLFEVSGGAAGSSGTTPSLGTGTLWLIDGAVGVCPVRLALGYGLSLRPCVQLAAGALSGTASGAHVLATGSTVEPWVALAPTGRVEWTVIHGLFVRAEAGPDVRFVQDRFLWNPSGQQFYAVPRVGSVARLGVGLYLP
jgi:hypothetical protein